MAPVHGTSRLTLDISVEGQWIFPIGYGTALQSLFQFSREDTSPHYQTPNPRPMWAVCPAENSCLQSPAPSLLSVTTLHYCQGDLHSLRSGGWICPTRLKIWVFSYCCKSTVCPIFMIFMGMYYKASVKVDHSLRKMFSYQTKQYFCDCTCSCMHISQKPKQK